MVSAMTIKRTKARRKATYRTYLSALFVATTCSSFAAFTQANPFAGLAPAPQPVAVKPIETAAIAKPQLSMTQGQAKYVVRTTLKSFADAMRTGNFTVFRDLSGPSMQARYSTAQLFQRFEAVANKGLDLNDAGLREPVLTAASSVAGTASVRLEGYVPGEPARVNFAMVLELHKGRWSVADLALDSSMQVAAVSGNELIAGSQ